jgi:hypothetical protein
MYSAQCNINMMIVGGILINMSICMVGTEVRHLFDQELFHMEAVRASMSKTYCS